MDAMGNGDKPIVPRPEYLDKAEDLDFAVAFARIECHYFINGIFVEDSHSQQYGFNPTHSCSHCPRSIRYGLPSQKCMGIAQAIPNSVLHIVPDAGHSMGEVPIASALVETTDSL